MRNAEATQERIMDAALAEFSGHGIAGARVDRIAKTAGCNKNLIYVYFGSKEALFAAVLKRHLARVYGDFPFTPEDLPGYAARSFDFAMANPDLMRLMAWSNLEQAEVPAPSPGVVGKLAGVAKAQADGVVGTTFPPAFLLAAALTLAMGWSGAGGFGAALDPEGVKDPEALRARIVEAVRRLVAV